MKIKLKKLEEKITFYLKLIAIPFIFRLKILTICSVCYPKRQLLFLGVLIYATKND